MNVNLEVRFLELIRLRPRSPGYRAKTISCNLPAGICGTIGRDVSLSGEDTTIQLVPDIPLHRSLESFEPSVGPRTGISRNTRPPLPVTARCWGGPDFHAVGQPANKHPLLGRNHRPTTAIVRPIGRKTATRCPIRFRGRFQADRPLGHESTRSDAARRRLYTPVRRSQNLRADRSRRHHQCECL